jgi:hypothetical protein
LLEIEHPRRIHHYLSFLKERSTNKGQDLANKPHDLPGTGASSKSDPFATRMIEIAKKITEHGRLTEDSCD